MTDADKNQPVIGETRQVKVFADGRAVAAAVARELVEIISDLQSNGGTVSDDGLVRLVLTGGTVGIGTLRELAVLDHAARVSADDFPVAAIDWNRVLVFFGDERFVAAEDCERNEVQAREALLDHVKIPTGNIVGYAAVQAGEHADGSALDQAAEAYAREVASKAPDGFDIHLLGMGPEGHVNSLFPHTDELMQPAGAVRAVRDCPKPPANRVTLTVPAINSSRRVWLIIAGQEKQEAAQYALAADASGQWPAGMVAGTEETVLWVDEAAQPQ